MNKKYQFILIMHSNGMKNVAYKNKMQLIEKYK